MQQALDYLHENRDRFVRELSDYVRFASVSAQGHHKQDVAACAQWIHDHCRDIGLQTRISATGGNPIVVAKTPHRPKAPSFLVYGHYDVQPAEPFDLWTSPPFEPRIDNGALFGRGSSDNKGQHLAHLNAVEAYLKTGTELPCNLTFVIEGEEEVGSEHLGTFLKANRAELKCDTVVISDNGIPSPKHPALTYGLRGIVAFEIIVHGPSRDLHSGIYGGSLENPAMALAQMLAKLRDKNGRITVPGFYDDVVPLTRYERKQLARLPFKEKDYKKFLGVPDLFGERGFTPIEQRSARPTLEINGLTSGYQGEGSKTIVPAWARAKITCRLVPNQTPAKIRQLVTKHLKSICPPTVRLEVDSGHGGAPYLVSPESAQAQAALRALKSAFGYDPLLMREGGSIPIVTDFKRQLGADTLLLGLALPDDNPHSPNEKFDLTCYDRGGRLGVHLWQELTASA
jgi:acetylornithine deacetylase/succinyl-diaminopimelate desuccinylase-like protein